MNDNERTPPPRTLAALGFARVAAVSPELQVADVEFNAARIDEAIAEAAQAGAAVIAFPELSLTAYSCADLFRQPTLLEAAAEAASTLAAAHPDRVVVVGLPVVNGDRLYNSAAVLAGGVVAGLVPKQYLPNRQEFYEDRWFSRADGAEPTNVRLAGADVPFGTDLVFDVAVGDGARARLGVEICEDLWSVEPPSGRLAKAGATILVNPSAGPDLLGKAAYRRDLVRMQSARCLAAYVYAGSGPGESTTDVVFAGHSMIAENGVLLGETERFRFSTQLTIADVDLDRLRHERLDNSSFGADRSPTVRVVDASAAPVVGFEPPLRRIVARHPFVPADPDQRARNCEEIFAIQATGLSKRLRHTGSSRLVIGISGGLDSTLALLVAVRAFDALDLPHDGITAITMPGFGTSDRTRDNAVGLMKALGVTVREVPIVEAVRAHFADIGHDEHVHDITFENAQARERTQILMDVANQVGGFVVGTGDLSEAALGWMTFNGDHMSMYHVNAGVPKTLVRYLVEWTADALFDGDVRGILHDIVDTPISPELLPLEDGQLTQRTEDMVGPYELLDFFLYHAIRSGARPAKVLALARQAFDGDYDDPTVLRWMEVFWRRFASQQFKRSSMPDGPKVGTVALSPRGDWRMPSDASAAPWLHEIAALNQPS